RHVRRVLSIELKHSFKLGIQRDIRSYASENVSYRGDYLKRRLSNYTQFWNPTRPEVERVTPGGKGRRVCILGAGVIHYNHVGVSSRVVNTSKNEDYHGNVDSALFENWFYKLCENLHTHYGPCRIHMDGAKYHKRNVNLAPNSNAKKEEMQRWLLHHEHAFDLYAIIKEKKADPRCATCIIAEGFEHEISFTPPYHPELQAIELIWGSVKHRIGLDPPTSIEDLHAKVWAGLNAHGSAAWVAAYRHVQKMQKKVFTFDRS
ncbi:TPA: hypothetical protein N0F65_009346, partial [Lagenidium giganteum]